MLLCVLCGLNSSDGGFKSCLHFFGSLYHRLVGFFGTLHGLQCLANALLLMFNRVEGFLCHFVVGFDGVHHLLLGDLMFPDSGHDLLITVAMCCKSLQDLVLRLTSRVKRTDCM